MHLQCFTRVHSSLGNRWSNYRRSLSCELYELKDLCFDVALDTLLNLFDELLEEFNQKNLFKVKGYEAAKMLTKNRLSSWYQEQTQYIQNILKAIAKEAFSWKNQYVFLGNA